MIGKGRDYVDTREDRKGCNGEREKRNETV